MICERCKRYVPLQEEQAVAGNNQLFISLRTLFMSLLSTPSRGLRTALTLMLIVLPFTFSPSPSAGSLMFSRAREGVKQKKMALGSRPPQCVNRCLSCKPCMAALVTPPHHGNGLPASSRTDESYYPLSWKCKCRNKYFQP